MIMRNVNAQKQAKKNPRLSEDSFGKGRIRY